MMQWIMAGFLGWLGGSVVNYLSDILPHKRRLVGPICLACGERQPWWNYLVWPRRCASCEAHRSIRIWIVEIIFIGASLWLWTSPPGGLGYWVGMTLLLYFGVVVVIDVEHRLILHPVSWAGALLGLGVGIWMHGLAPTLIGGAAGFGLMLALHSFGNLFARGMARLRGEPIDEVALGFGDVNLSGVLGLLLGWPGIVGGLLLAILLGGVVSLFYLLIMLIRRRYQVFTAIPYGPFLVASAILLLYFQESLLSITF
ncbi:MAG: prepilin peptidase [Anaerolineales bacterium]|nr:prepilin peptidase [Anaerolineales bacterium]